MISVLWRSLALGLWLIRQDGFHLLRLTDSSYYGLSLLHYRFCLITRGFGWTLVEMMRFVTNTAD